MVFWIDKDRLKIIREGTWLYDGSVEMTVLLAELEYDPWYELAKHDEFLEEDESPDLNADGKCYYLSLPTDNEKWPYHFVGQAKHSVAEVESYAQSFFESGVTWK